MRLSGLGTLPAGRSWPIGRHSLSPVPCWTAGRAFVRRKDSEATMTRAIYISPDPVAGPLRATALSCGWMATAPLELAAAVNGQVPCAVVVGASGTQVFKDTPPVTASTVTNAIAASVAQDVAAANAQATLDANAAVLRQRGLAALVSNATYLAIASPTAAQVATQSKALTRQVDGVIRLLLGVLDSLADS